MECDWWWMVVMKSVRDHLPSRSLSASSSAVEAGGNKRWGLFHWKINASLWPGLGGVLNSGTALWMSASSSPARQLQILLLFLLALIPKRNYLLPSAITGWLGPTLDLFENNQGWRSFNQIFYASPTPFFTFFWKEGIQGTTLSFPLVLESYQSLLLPYFLSLSHRFCIRWWWAHAKTFSFFYWRPIGRLLDWVESLPTQRIKVPIRARARTGQARTSWSKAPLFWSE